MNAGLTLGWPGIVRLGLVQAALGSVVVLITSTLNRVMVVEYSLPAVLPGFLVALHYAVQMIRPRFGHGSDRGGRRTPWILGGMATLAVGAVLCAVATVTLSSSPAAALMLAVFGYVLVGLGVGAAGTSLLALMATRVDADRRAAAATIMWLLMVAGFAVTATTAGHFLDPFSPRRLILVTSIAAVAAWLLALAAVWKVEGRSAAGHAPARDLSAVSFKSALKEIWTEPLARRFTLFVFLSMLAYSAQELILEPFSGLIFNLTLGDSSKLSGLQHAGGFPRHDQRGRRLQPSALRQPAVMDRRWLRGLGGGAARAGRRRSDRSRGAAAHERVFAGCVERRICGCRDWLDDGFEYRREPGHAGARMGLWGAAQAAAFAAGGVFGTSLVDLIRYVYGSPQIAFATVFCAEAALFFLSAALAAQINRHENRSTRHATVVTA